MKVKDCMCNEVLFVKPEATIKEVAEIMLDKHIGCIPVCNEGKQILGLVTDRDLVSRGIATGKDVNHTPISEIMTTKVYNVAPDSEVSEANKVMCDCQIKRVPVIENSKIVGIITLGDLANNRQISCDDVGNTVEGICKCTGTPKNAE